MPLESDRKGEKGIESGRGTSPARAAKSNEAAPPRRRKQREPGAALAVPGRRRSILLRQKDGKEAGRHRLVGRIG
jgi:hypothetical protein